jgi:hypothetical protein
MILDNYQKRIDRSYINDSMYRLARSILRILTPSVNKFVNPITHYVTTNLQKDLPALHSLLRYTDEQ